MRQVQVFIEGQKLDLFQDEQINVTSSQQNVQDISKVFTDFSQTFSCPSTPNNDAIFSHFYNSDIGDLQDVSTQFDANIRREAFIEIDYTTFRRGKIQLEKAEIKDNQPYSYQITFYGDITSLKDKFGDDKLINLSYLQTFGHAYTGSNIQDRITDGSTNYTMRYPLITRRYLQYDNPQLPNDDINTNTGAIQWSELFPAVKISGIFAAIQIQYNIDFEGTFLQDKRFQNCFLYCQNKDEFQFFTNTKEVNFTTGGEYTTNTQTYLDYFDLTENTLTIQPITFLDAFLVNPSNQFWETQIEHKVLLDIFSSSTTAEYYVDVIVNDVVTTTLTGTNGIQQIAYKRKNFQINTQDVIKFRVKATESNTVVVRAQYFQQGSDPSGVGTGFSFYTNEFFADSSNVLTGNIDPIAYLPDMKVSDFFSAILKEFNLTCYGLEKDVFQIEPIDDWYLKGDIIDVTEYVDVNSIKVDRLKLFRSIELKYEPSENILNNQFRELFNREYGDAQIAFDYDGGEYKIEQPFENMKFNKFTGTDLQVGFTIDKDFNTYVPKPMLLYMYDETPTSFKFYDGNNYQTITEYMPFGQDVKVNTENFTLNFNAEISTFTGFVEQNTLFETYYFGYLSNLFKLKNRRYNMKANLPVSLLTSLRLNDRLLIRDKRYIIESIKTNLNSGDVDLVLINDFRSIIVDTGTNQPIVIPIDKERQTIDVPILFPKEATRARVSSSDSGVSISPSNITEEQIVEVTLPDNSGTTTVLKTEDNVDYINTEDSDRIRTEGGDSQIYTVDIDYIYRNGTQTTSKIYILQDA